MTLCDTWTKNNRHISHFCTTTVLHCDILHCGFSAQCPQTTYGARVQHLSVSLRTARLSANGIALYPKESPARRRASRATPARRRGARVQWDRAPPSGTRGRRTRAAGRARRWAAARGERPVGWLARAPQAAGQRRRRRAGRMRRWTFLFLVDREIGGRSTWDVERREYIQYTQSWKPEYCWLLVLVHVELNWQVNKCISSTRN